MKIEVRLIRESGEKVHPSTVIWKLWKQLESKIDRYLDEK